MYARMLGVSKQLHTTIKLSHCTHVSVIINIVTYTCILPPSLSLFLSLSLLSPPPLLQCFSSIVGPNGSGKSNVIDSMLFVFGYRARKIRSKKVAVLIHNSEHHQNIQSCTVSVHFQKIIDLVRKLKIKSIFAQF